MTARGAAIALIIAVLALGLTERTIGPVRTLVTTITRPIAQPLSELTQSVRSIGAAVREINTLRSENSSLKQENVTLKAHIAELASLTSENDALRQALTFETAHRDQPLIASQVIARSPTSFLDSLTIDRGLDDGVVADAPVITNGYLIGTIIRAQSHTATVRLITSSDTLLPVVFAASRAQGLLKGGLTGLVVTEVPSDTKVAVDEPVVTSALGGKIAANIPVGSTRNAEPAASSIVQTIHITTPIALNRVEVVFVGQPTAKGAQ